MFIWIKYNFFSWKLFIYLYQNHIVVLCFAQKTSDYFFLFLYLCKKVTDLYSLFFRNAVEENKKLYAIYDTRWVTKSAFKMLLLLENGMLTL